VPLLQAFFFETDDEENGAFGALFKAHLFLNGPEKLEFKLE
jgi:hypothetical protein